ncbi:hypothetical protein V1517DRAFT_311036 [Lipomyces orientalis]|uniref:Uncharacterized protein n=1 Tax=Lipomyces orientalis TaxID=1233043 RepID=A0ACC3TEK8_9ASCO
MAKKIYLDGRATIVPKSGQSNDEDFSTVVELKEQDDSASVNIPGLTIDDWQGWAWVRPSQLITLLTRRQHYPYFFALQLKPLYILQVPARARSQTSMLVLEGPRLISGNGLHCRQVTYKYRCFDSVDDAIYMAKKYLGTIDAAFSDPPANDRGYI